MSAIAWNTVYPCMFRPPLTAKKQENGHLKNAPRPALRGGVRWQVGALRPPALSCTVFNPSVHTPNTEQSPARISGLTAIPVGTPAQSPHTAFQAGGGVRMPARRQNAPQGRTAGQQGVIRPVTSAAFPSLLSPIPSLPQTPAEIARIFLGSTGPSCPGSHSFPRH